jgi:hypothetical protein
MVDWRRDNKFNPMDLDD